MTFNPLKEKGTPIEKQIQNWGKLNTKPYDKNSVHPYTRTRGILMNGIETEAVIFGHQFLRSTTDMDLRRKLSLVRRIEQQQQKIVNWMIPGNESTLEVTIGYEQVAVDLTSQLARTEPDPYVKAALDFALLEDFDHLYRYANLMETLMGIPAERIVGEYTEVFPGRPTVAEHRHPFDEPRKPSNDKKSDILSKLHILTIISAEQQTMNYYMNVGNRFDDHVARGLYQEIAMIEEQHVTHYGCLADPNASWFEQLVMHEYNECYMYYSCLESETDKQAKMVWEMLLDEEITHLQMACDLMRQYEKKDPEHFLPKELPSQLTIFEPNKDYVRQILAEQVDWTANEAEFVTEDKEPDRYKMYQQLVNEDGFVPSQRVVEDNIDKAGRDYRLETEGPHPVERFRAREEVMV